MTLKRILNLMSAFLVIMVIVRWEEISLSIANAAIKVLTGGIPFLAAMIFITIAITRFTWRMRYRFWGW